MWKGESKLTKETIAWLGRDEGSFWVEIYERLMAPSFLPDWFPPSEAQIVERKHRQTAGFMQVVSWVKLVIVMPLRMPK